MPNIKTSVAKAKKAEDDDATEPNSFAVDMLVALNDHHVTERLTNIIRPLIREEVEQKIHDRLDNIQKNITDNTSILLSNTT